MSDTSYIQNQQIDFHNDIKIHELEFLKLIGKRLGITIKEHQIGDLYKTIEKACVKFQMMPNEYLKTLIECHDNSPELEFLVSGITIGETYFFRDSHQMSLIHEKILPNIIKNKRSQNNLSLRIWSAGCASGEEIYTIAMILDNLLPDINKWHIALLGTDINTNSLKKAIAGVYTEWSMRAINPYYKHRYFTLEKRNYHISNEIKKLVSFEYLNLHDDMYPSVFNNTNAQDLILCRNVLIYFDTNHILNLMKKLNACLIEDAFLLLGASDPIITKETTLSSYQREGALLQNKLKVPFKPKAKSISNDPIVHRALIVPKPQSTTPVIKPVAEKVVETKDEMINQLIADALKLANEGKLDLAQQICHETLKRFPTHDVAHFTLAMILEEENKLIEAEKMLRITIFLNHKFVAAHFKLGLILIRNRQIKEGLKYLKNALDIALSRNPGEIVEGFNDLNYEQLSEILKREIDLHLMVGDMANGSKNTQKEYR